jgi:hypothetical protein
MVREKNQFLCRIVFPSSTVYYYGLLYILPVYLVTYQPAGLFRSFNLSPVGIAGWRRCVVCEWREDKHDQLQQQHKKNSYHHKIEAGIFLKSRERDSEKG